MLKNNKGFSLVEVLSSFAIFLVLITSVIPISMKIYEGRTSLDYKKEALVLLHNEKEAYLYDDVELGEKIVTVAAREYKLTIQNEGDLLQFCVTWNLPWKKKGKVCDYAKK